MNWLFYSYLSTSFIPVWSRMTEGPSLDDIKIQKNPNSLSTIDGLRNAETEPILAFTEPKPPQILEASRYQSVSIRCAAAVVNGIQPRVYWVRNGAVVSPGVNVSDAYHVQPALSTVTTSLLSLQCVTTETSGDYVCVAESPNVRIETVTKVVVVIGRFSRAMYMAWQRRCPEEGLASRIVMSTARYIQDVEGDILLYCRAAGDPHPTTTWYFHAGPFRNATEDHLQKIRNDHRNYHVLHSGDLLIRKIKKEDHGYYICGARNIHGSDFMASYVYPVAVLNQN